MSMWKSTRALSQQRQKVSYNNTFQCDALAFSSVAPERGRYVAGTTHAKLAKAQ